MLVEPLACVGPACAPGRAPGTSSGCTGSESANTATGSVLHNSCVDTAKHSARLSAQNVGLGDGQVVARNRQIEIIFEGEANCVF